MKGDAIDWDERFRPFVPFVSDDPSVSLGFEAGRVYAYLSGSWDFVTFSDVFHSENADNLELVAQRLGWDTERKPEGDGWVRMRFKRL